MQNESFNFYILSFSLFFLYCINLSIQNEELDVKFSKLITNKHIRINAKILFNKYERIRYIQ